MVPVPHGLDEESDQRNTFELLFKMYDMVG